jgi:hypothetical protein
VKKARGIPTAGSVWIRNPLNCRVTLGSTR